MLDDVLSLKDYKDVLMFEKEIECDTVDFVDNLLEVLHTKFNYEILSFFKVNKKGEFIEPQNINFGDEAIEVYTNYYYKKDPFYFKNLNSDLVKKDSILLNEIVNSNNFAESEYYSDFFNKYNFHNEIGLYIKNGDKHIGAMGVLRSNDEEKFNIHDQALLNTLCNIISYKYSQYIEKQKFIEYHKQLENAFLQYPVGIVITNSKFEIIHYNRLGFNYCKDIFNYKDKNLVYRTIIDIINLNCSTNNKIPSNFVMENYKFKVIKSNAQGTNGNKYINNYIFYITPFVSKEDFYNKYSLTEREVEIVELISKGMTNKEIGSKLYISPQTVRTHICNIMNKTDTNSRTEILFKVGKIK